MTVGLFCEHRQKKVLILIPSRMFPSRRLEAVYIYVYMHIYDAKIVTCYLVPVFSSLLLDACFKCGW